jgi:tetratricopeptide (TPR) repeat protein
MTLLRPARLLLFALVLGEAAGTVRADEAAPPPGQVSPPAGVPPEVERTMMTDVRVGIAAQDRMAETHPREGISRIFAHLAKSTPDNLVLRYLAGRAAGDREGAAQMRAALEQRLGLPPTERVQIAAGWFALARREAELGLDAQALESASFSLRLVPEGRTYALLGWLHQRAGRTDDAIASFTRAVREEMRDLRSRLSLTDLLIRAGRVEEALHVARGSLLVDPRSGLAHLYWGTALALAGNADDARTAYQRALRLAQDDPDQVAAVAAALRRIDGQVMAQDALAKAYAAHPEHMGLATQLATLYLESGRHAQATAILDLALRAHPDDAPAWFLRGLSRDGAKDAKDAAAAYQKAARLAPDQLEYQLALASAQRRTGDGRAALRTLRAAATKFSEDARAREMFARGLLDEGEYVEAAREFEVVARMRPMDPNPCYFLAVVKGAHLGQPREARVWLERYSALGGVEPAALEWLEELRKTTR